MPQPAPSSNVIKIISGSRGRFPIKLGLVPDQLAVTIYLHEENSVAGKIPCWSYLTEGLTKLNQKEILLTLRVNQGEDRNKFQTSPLQIFLLLYKQALQQKTVDIGDTMKLGSKGLFSFPGAGFTFPLNNPTQLPLKRPTLSCVLLTEEEFITAQGAGFTRVLARMGYEQDHYPCLPWNNRERHGLRLRAMLQNSVLKDTIRLPLKHTACYMEDGETVVLNIPSSLSTYLNKAIAKTAGKPLCLLTQLLPGHDGCLAWLPHKDTSQIVNAPNSAGEFIGGSFLMLNPEQANDGAVMLEDGFCANLTGQSWQMLQSALMNGTEMIVKGGGGHMHFALNCSGNKAQMEKPFPHSQAAGNNEADNESGIISRLFRRFSKP